MLFRSAPGPDTHLRARLPGLGCVHSPRLPGRFLPPDLTGSSSRSGTASGRRRSPLFRPPGALQLPGRERRWAGRRERNWEPPGRRREKRGWGGKSGGSRRRRREKKRRKKGKWSPWRKSPEGGRPSALGEAQVQPTSKSLLSRLRGMPLEWDPARPSRSSSFQWGR